MIIESLSESYNCKKDSDTARGILCIESIDDAWHDEPLRMRQRGEVLYDLGCVR